MDKRIDFITLIFENCDYINIPYKVINMLRLYRVSYNYNFYQNKTDISATAEYILISLNINLIKDIKSDFNVLLRIMKYADITCIQLHYLDKTIENIYTNYEGIEFNKLQDTKIDNDILIIKIGKNSKGIVKDA